VVGMAKEDVALEELAAVGDAAIDEEIKVENV
jgi:hypothetical protein